MVRSSLFVAVVLGVAGCEFGAGGPDSGTDALPLGDEGVAG